MDALRTNMSGRHTDPQAPELDLFLMTDIFEPSRLFHAVTVFTHRESWKANVFGLWLICTLHVLIDPFQYSCLLKSALIPEHCFLAKLI